MSTQLGLGFAQAPSFHDRDHVMPERERVQRNTAASRQERDLLEWFECQEEGDGRFTPWEIEEVFSHFERPIPITSVRRALTNMTKRGELIHYPRDRRKSGPYGQTSGTWGLA